MEEEKRVRKRRRTIWRTWRKEEKRRNYVEEDDE